MTTQTSTPNLTEIHSALLELAPTGHEAPDIELGRGTLDVNRRMSSKGARLSILDGQAFVCASRGYRREVSGSAPEIAKQLLEQALLEAGGTFDWRLAKG